MAPLPTLGASLFACLECGEQLPQSFRQTPRPPHELKTKAGHKLGKHRSGNADLGDVPTLNPNPSFKAAGNEQKYHTLNLDAATIDLPKQAFMPLPKSHSQLQLLTRWEGGVGGGGMIAHNVCALLVPYLSQCCLFCSLAFSCACCLGVGAADKQVHVPVVPKSWQTMRTPPKQRRLSAAIAFVAVV